MSDTNAADAWVAMLAALPNIRTDATADAGKYSYKYASLPSILELVRPVLKEYGWGVTQDVATLDGNPAVTTVFDHISGDQRRYGPLSMPATGAGAQAVGSAITYARRYALVAALGLAPDDDDDGAAASQPKRRPEAPKVEELLPRDQAWKHVWDACDHDMDRAAAVFKAGMDELHDRNIDTPEARDALVTVMDRMILEGA